MANCLAETLNQYGLLEKAEAVVFDTTASNTGVRQGCVFLFEKIIQRAVLWLACRHHTSELFIKHANIEVRGPTTGPDDVLFKLFKKKFNLIDTTQLERWIWPANTDWRHQRAEDVLEWADLHMSQGTWPREDYREMVELTVSWFIFNLIFPTNFKSCLRLSATTILQRSLSILNHANPNQLCRVFVKWVFQIVWPPLYNAPPLYNEIVVNLAKASPWSFWLLQETAIPTINMK